MNPAHFQLPTFQSINKTVKQKTMWASFLATPTISCLSELICFYFQWCLVPELCCIMLHYCSSLLLGIYHSGLSQISLSYSHKGQTCFAKTRTSLKRDCFFSTQVVQTSGLRFNHRNSQVYFMHLLLQVHSRARSNKKLLLLNKKKISLHLPKCFFSDLAINPVFTRIRSQ